MNTARLATTTHSRTVNKMHFKKFELREWQQFENIEIELHPKLTILTGGNGCGKTTLLNFFARHGGWSNNSLATPKKDESTGVMRFFSRFYRGKNKADQPVIGFFEYSNGTKGNLRVDSAASKAEYHVRIDSQGDVKTIYIPSHRSLFRYEKLSNIPAAKKNKQTAFNEVMSNNQQRYQGSGGRQQSPSFFMKSTLIGWAIQGYGVQNVMPSDDEQIRSFEGFQTVLRKVLPATIGFQKLEIRDMEVVFVCNDGTDEFLLETASGGISAIIEMAWQIFMFSTKDNHDFTVIIDEVENHLHPIMQRKILGDFVDAFPTARFIVSTHSPLVVSSVKESSIYALRYNSEGKVQSEKLDMEREAKNALEVLDDVLGVSFTIPVWAEDKLKSIVARYASVKSNDYNLSSMRGELEKEGLGRFMPDAITSLIEQVDD